MIKKNDLLTNRFDSRLSYSLHRTLKFQLALIYQFLSTLIKWIRYLVRFEMLKTWQKKLFRLYREKMGEARSLPPVTHAEITVSDVVIPIPGENIELKGNLYLPVEAAEGRLKVPVVLIRTPYDKDSPFMGPGLARVFAERGYGCLIQDTRGRFGSGGDFFPIAHEVKDGAATVKWLREQSWSNNFVGTFGISYLGLTAYAAAGGGERVDACVPIMACSRLYPVIYHGGSAFSFDLVIRWLWLVMNVMQEKNPLKKIAKVLTPHRHLEAALHPVGVTPVNQRDHDIVGKELDFYRSVMESHENGHDFWTSKDVLCDLSKKESSPPLSIIAGWHDIFALQSFADFKTAAAVKTDAPLTMTVGDWSHWDGLGYSTVGFSAAFELFDEQLKGLPRKNTDDDSDPEAMPQNRPTKMFVQVLHSESSSHPRGKWLKFNCWPPVHRTNPMPMYFGASGRLFMNPPLANGGGKTFTEHLYDPKNPTPHAGGPGFNWLNSGKTAQNDLEARDDVLVFTSAMLRDPVTVVGEVSMKLYLWSSNPHTDVFVKVCDVNGENGQSYNVMEKMTRLSPTSHEWDAEGNVVLDIELGPIAVLFKRGNYIRIQVTGSAHPLYLRSTGHADHTSMELKPALRKIKHSADCPTQIVFPVLST